MAKSETACCGKCPKAKLGTCSRLDKVLAALKTEKDAR